MLFKLQPIIKIFSFVRTQLSILNKHDRYIATVYYNAMGSDSILKHPYFPRDLSIPHYKPNKVSIQELLGIFFSLVLIVFIITWIYSTKKKFSVGYRLLLCWFTICGFIHTILEGYFAFNHSTLAGGSSYLAEMCKYDLHHYIRKVLYYELFKNI